MSESLFSSMNATIGQIQIIFGPMFSGKTTELMRRLKRYQIAKHNCLVVKYANDVRYDKDHLATHDQQTLSAVSATFLGQLKEKAQHYTIIGIDEGQFFPDTVEFSECMANLGKVVIVAALDGTYQRVGFGSILQLVPLAESVIKLTAVCMRCYQEASYTMRISEETALEVIGGSDKYIAVCRRCYLEAAQSLSAGSSPLKEINGVQEKIKTVAAPIGINMKACSKTLVDKENCATSVIAPTES